MTRPEPDAVNRNRQAVILLLLILALPACFSDQMSSSHNSRADALGDIERGWIPSVLPESTTIVRETHNLDTNVGHGTFEIDAAGSGALKKVLLPLPSELEIGGTPSRSDLEKNGYAFYSWEDFVIAVNWQEHQGHFWTGPQH